MGSKLRAKGTIPANKSKKVVTLDGKKYALVIEVSVGGEKSFRIYERDAVPQEAAK